MNSESNDEKTEPEYIEEFVAELVDEAPMAPGIPASPTVAYDPSILVRRDPSVTELPPSPMAHLAAKGGAVGAIVLGVLAFVGSFVTSYAILNAMMGIFLGLWGLKSNHRRSAIIGMAICLVSAFFCVVEISSWLQSMWPSEETF